MISKPTPLPLGGLDNMHLVRQSSTPLTVYLGSPSVCHHKGEIFVSCDEFGSGSSMSSSGTTRLYVYDLDTNTPTLRATINGLFWARFITYDPNVLYMWGTSKENGNIVIAKSTDAGFNWTVTTLFSGSFHCAPTSFALWGDYAILSMERINTGAPVGTVGTGRPIGVKAYRININDDPTVSGNWDDSNEITYDNAWFGGFEILEFSPFAYQNEVHFLGRTLYREAMPHLTYDVEANVLTRQTSILCPWGWMKSSIHVDDVTGDLFAIGNVRHAPHAGGGSVDEDRTWIKIWKTKNFFQNYEEKFELIDFGEPYWRSKGVQYPYGLMYKNPENKIDLLVGLRVGLLSNTPHNSNELRLGIYRNYGNLIA